MAAKKKTVQKTFFSAGGVLLLLVILILVNVVFARVVVRYDATADNLFSLSDGTRQLLSEIETPVTIKVFYTEDLPNLPNSLKSFAGRVLDFLQEYEALSEGKVTIERYNPKMDSEEEEWAIKYGLQGMDLATGDRIFFGLVALAADQEEAIAFIDPAREAHLEYDLTRMISRVQKAKKLKIGIITGLPIFGAPSMQQFGGQEGMQPWLFVNELRKTYTVDQIQPTASEIPADTDLIILFHPKNIGDQLLYAVDQYVLKGGNLIAYVDPMSLLDNPRQGPTASWPKKLFDAWGLEMESDKVVIDYNYATRLRNQNNQPETNPMWLSLGPQAFNSDNIVTAELESALMPLAGAITLKADSPYDFEPLLTSSTNAALVESFKHSLPVDLLRRDFKPEGRAFNLAVKVTGKFKSAFPDGPPKPAPADGETDTAEKKQSADGLTEASASATLYLFADSDMLYDGYYVSRQNFLGMQIANIFNDNLNLLLNASELLTGSDALISIRSRGSFERPFLRVKALEQKAQAKWLDREQELVHQVEATNEKLRALESRKDASQKTIVSPEQEAEIAKFQKEKLRINHELKLVRRNLRSEIDALGRTLKVINIFLMPVLVSLVGIAYALYRRRKVAQHQSAD
jgi:ABC-type uncharacterized transport system involved in gliding motility auxiliary subunit